MNNPQREHAYRERIIFLEEENEKLRRRIKTLLPNDHEFMLALQFKLTRSEEALLSGLMGRLICSKEYLLDCLLMCFDDRMNEPSIKIIDVHMYSLRTKLKKRELNIETQWGWGYYLTKETKQKIMLLSKPEIYNELSQPTPRSHI